MGASLIPYTYADEGGVDIKTFFSPAETFPTIGSLVSILIKNVMVIAGIITFIMIVMIGWKVIQAAGQGESDKMSQGKDALKAAIIGLVLIVSAYWIVQIVQYVTGVSILEGAGF